MQSAVGTLSQFFALKLVHSLVSVAWRFFLLLEIGWSRSPVVHWVW
jgi:hypothetical protein